MGVELTHGQSTYIIFFFLCIPKQCVEYVGFLRKGPNPSILWIGPVPTVLWKHRFSCQRRWTRKRNRQREATANDINDISCSYHVVHPHLLSTEVHVKLDCWVVSRNSEMLRWFFRIDVLHGSLEISRSGCTCTTHDMCHAELVSLPYLFTVLCFS